MYMHLPLLITHIAAHLASSPSIHNVLNYQKEHEYIEMTFTCKRLRRSNFANKRNCDIKLS